MCQNKRSFYVHLEKLTFKVLIISEIIKFLTHHKNTVESAVLFCSRHLLETTMSRSPVGGATVGVKFVKHVLGQLGLWNGGLGRSHLDLLLNPGLLPPALEKLTTNKSSSQPVSRCWSCQETQEEEEERMMDEGRCVRSCGRTTG